MQPRATNSNDHDSNAMMMMSNSVNKMQVIKLTSAMSFTTMLIILWQNKHHVLPAVLFAEEIVISEYVNSAVFRECLACIRFENDMASIC